MTTTARFPSPAQPSTSRIESASLLLAWGSNELRAVAVREGQPLVIGRSFPADEIIEDRSLSRTHVRFSFCAGTVHFEDLGSTNGVLLDGRRELAGVLTLESTLRLGAVQVELANGRPRSPELARADPFDALLAQELTRARFFHRPLSLVAVDTRNARSSALPCVLRPVDIAVEYAPGITLLALPEAREEQVQELASALFLGNPSGYRIGALSHPRCSGSAEELIARTIDAVRSAELDGLRWAREQGEAANALDRPVVVAANMKRVHALINRAARTTLPVLILGETGSGKEFFASAVHVESGRSERPFKAVNCGSLPSTLATSILFGHERGAFTGADRQTPGLFEQAHTGTLFLDEIGELPQEAQAALLRVLETGRLTRLGGRSEFEVDVRIVAATHRDLPQRVAEGSFRQDLLYRLDAFSVRIPPLRERVEEIIPLAEHFLTKSRSRWSTPATKLSPQVLHALEAYPWPGNVRQLRNVIDRAAATCLGEQIELDDLPDALFERPDLHRAVATQSRGSSRNVEQDLSERVQNFERDAIREALVASRGNQSEAARLLGLPRRTLAHKAHAYGLVTTKVDGSS